MPTTVVLLAQIIDMLPITKTVGTGQRLAVDKEGKGKACYDSLLFVVVDDGIHHVHHGFSGTEHGLDVVEPFVALEEIV